MHFIYLTSTLYFIYSDFLFTINCFFTNCLFLSPKVKSHNVTGAQKSKKKAWKKNPGFPKLRVNDKLGCALDSCCFPVSILRKQLTGGKLNSSDRVHTRDLYLFLATASTSHTCMIPPRVSGDIFFPANSVYMRPGSSLFVMWVLQDQACGSQRKSLPRLSEKTNSIVFAKTQIRRI